MNNPARDIGIDGYTPVVWVLSRIGRSLLWIHDPTAKQLHAAAYPDTADGDAAAAALADYLQDVQPYLGAEVDGRNLAIVVKDLPPRGETEGCSAKDFDEIPF